MYKIKTNQELKLLYTGIYFIAFTFDCFTRIYIDSCILL